MRNKKAKRLSKNRIALLNLLAAILGVVSALLGIVEKLIDRD